MDDPRDLHRLQRRINSVVAVRQVIHAVWALAHAQLPLAEAAVAESATYLDWLGDVVERLAGPHEARPESGLLLVVLGPERPLCGPLARRLLAEIPDGCRVGLVGRRLADAAASERRLQERVLFSVPGAAAHDEVDDIARTLAESILAHAGDDVVELRWAGSGGDRPARAPLLTGRREQRRGAPQTLSPVGVVLDAAVRESVVGRLTSAVAESLLAEVRARAAAADAARRACDRRLDALRQAWRAATQERITNELLEVVAGHAASSPGPDAARSLRDGG